MIFDKNDPKDTIVCVTGIFGHLGSVVAMYLCKEGYQVRGLCHQSQPAELLEGLPIEYFKGDVTDPKTLDTFLAHEDGKRLCVIHCAGLISIITNYQEKLHKVNVTGTKNVIDAAIRHHADKFVYVSSVHAIAVPREGGIITETKVFDPSKIIGDYAKTKCEATAYALSRADYMDITVVQPSGIIGPYDLGRNDLVALIDSIINGRRYTGVAGGYDMVDVRDVAEGAISALKHGRRGECYILSGDYVSIEDIMKISLKAAGVEHGITVLPLWVGRMAAPFAEGYALLVHQKPLFTRYAIHTVSTRGTFSHAKATTELGYDSRPIEQTIEDTVGYLQQHEKK
jgi:dihydroflavonol-4-reductase